MSCKRAARSYFEATSTPSGDTNALGLGQRVRQALADVPQTTAQHAVLVSVSMLGAIVLAVPMGVLTMAGRVPAILALFVYSLLPIVRTTHAGLTTIPQSVRDSVRSLGLPRGRMLIFVELPLALSRIFAGIKTAVVINVGTATLGGFIAAGGYGDPILAGIRRVDTVLILAGLVPAALMAIVLTLGLDLLERVLSPARGPRATTH